MADPTNFESPDEEIEFDIDVAENDEGNPEVDVADEAPEPDAEPEEKPAPEPEPEADEDAPKPARNRAKERIAELARRAAEAEAKAAQYENAIRQYQQQLTTSGIQQVEQAELALKSELAVAKRELIEAKALGDYEKEAEATIRISKLNSDLSTVEVYKANAMRQVQQQPQQQAPQPQQGVQIDPRTAAWVEQNSWFNPKSPDYDAEMAAEAQHTARKLEVQLQREGKAHMIGSAEYFAVIDEHVRTQYPEMFDAPAPKRKMPAMSAGKDVAPVGRQTAAVQPAPKKSTVRLTADERDIAERTFPGIPPQQAWAKYARYK